LTSQNILAFVTKSGIVFYVLVNLVAVIVWLTTGSPAFLIGFAFGGAVSLISFDLSKRIGHKVVSNPTDLKLQYFVLLWVKFFVVIVICFVSVMFKLVNVAAFTGGLSIIVFAIIVSAGITTVQEYRKDYGEEPQPEQFIGWDDVDKTKKFVYKPKDKSAIDKL